MEKSKIGNFWDPIDKRYVQPGDLYQFPNHYQINNLGLYAENDICVGDVKEGMIVIILGAPWSCWNTFNATIMQNILYDGQILSFGLAFLEELLGRISDS